MWLVYALLFVAAVSQWTSVEAVRDLGPCPKRSVKESFQMSQFSGLWFELQRYKVSFEAGLSCVETTYSPAPYTHFKMRNIGIAANVVPSIVEGDGYAPDDSSPAKLLIRMDGIPGVSNYWILDTDYYNYAVVLSCADQGIFHEELAWVFSRNRTAFNPQAQDQVNAVIAANKFSPSNFVQTTQTKCVN